MAGDGRHAGARRGALRFDLVAHRLDRRRVRPDEHDARSGERLGKGGALGQEAIARMDGLSAGPAAGVEDLVDHQVGLGGGRRADRHRLVRHVDMERAGIGIGIDGDGAEAHAPRRPDDPTGDLATVGNQDLVEHCSGRPQLGMNGTSSRVSPERVISHQTNRKMTPAMRLVTANFTPRRGLTGRRRHGPARPRRRFHGRS